MKRARFAESKARHSRKANLGLDPAGELARAPDRLVVKLLRALGGCLGVRRRRRTWLAAISCVEPQAGVDAQMSEWGNPLRVMSQEPFTESIGERRPTRGIETSQYPEEKKSNQRFRK
jgi:hypothetical protein